MATPSPFLSMWWMVTGKAIDGTPMRGPEESLSRQEALQAYTRGSAWLVSSEDLLGSIEAGKLADLVVLSDDYLGVPEDAIRDLRPLMTVVGGRVVYAEPSWAR